jgi:endonuclease/exonuclease/phosphatase family metal-dependent hydrolase
MLTRIVLVAALWFTANCVHAETLRLATLNCEFLVLRKIHMKYGYPFTLRKASDKRKWAPLAYRQAKLDDAIKVVAKEVAAIHATVIVLTEVGTDKTVVKLKRQVQALGVNYPHHFTCKSSDTATGQHVAVLAKVPLSNRLSKIPGKKFYQPESDDSEEALTSVSKGLMTSFQFAGNKINLYAVHLTSERGGGEADAKRIAQASIIRRHYLPKLKNKEHVVVVGDLNDKRVDPTLRRVRGLDDIYEDLVQTGNKRYFAKKDIAERWTYQFNGVKNQIDHILPSWSLINAAKVRASVYQPTGKLPGNFRVTDHRSLIVEFDF